MEFMKKKITVMKTFMGKAKGSRVHSKYFPENPHIPTNRTLRNIYKLLHLKARFHKANTEHIA